MLKWRNANMCHWNNGILEGWNDGLGRVDLFDITSQTIYEFETSVSPKYRKEANEKYRQSGVEVIVVDINSLPDDIFQRYLKLKEYVILD